MFLHINIITKTVHHNDVTLKNSHLPKNQTTCSEREPSPQSPAATLKLLINLRDLLLVGLPKNFLDTYRIPLLLLQLRNQLLLAQLMCSSAILTMVQMALHLLLNGDLLLSPSVDKVARTRVFRRQIIAIQTVLLIGTRASLMGKLCTSNSIVTSTQLLIVI